jgi:HEAT repeat protein
MREIEGLLADLASGDDNRAEPVIEHLASTANEYSPVLLEAIYSLLSDSSEVDTRWWAVRALVEIPEQRAIDLLIETLGDAEPAVRQCAALGLRKRPDPQAVPALIAALSDPDPLCATLAADTLIIIGEPSVLPLLERLSNGSRAFQLEAVRALAMIGDKRAIPAFFNLLDEDSAIMEYWANTGLERMGVGMTFFKP